MKHEIEDITLKQYFELKDHTLYNYCANYSTKLNTPNDLFEVGEFTKFTFGLVKDLQYTFANGINWMELINFVRDYKKISTDKLVSYTFFEWCKFRRFIEVQLETIYRIELSLNYDVSGREEAAGIDELAMFGIQLQIDELAHGKIWMYDIIRDQDYMRAFTKLLMDKKKNEYNRAVNKIKR